MEFETIQEFEQDGWQISVAIAPDYDYAPGRDDDIYCHIEDVLPGHDDEYEATFPHRHGMAGVKPGEVDRIMELGGCPERMRARLIDDARSIADESLSWVVVRVSAKRGDISGSDILGGVEYDLRENNPEKYATETVGEYAMVENAIEDAARATVGGLATLALSY